MSVVEGPVSSVDDVRARPWHFGARVVTGPAYEASGFEHQIDHPAAVSCIIVRPAQKTLEEWAKTCLAVEHYEGEDYFGGWSPGRSVEVQVTTADGTEERVESHYYKLFDFNAADVDLHPVQTRPLPEPLAWLPVWKDFIHTSIGLVLSNMHRIPAAAHADCMVLDMVGREVAVWNGDIVTMISTALGNSNTDAPAPQAFIVEWSRTCFWGHVHTLARLGVAEVFQVWPQMVLLLLGISP